MKTSVTKTYHIAFQVLLMMVFVASGFAAQQASLPPELIPYADMVLYNGKVVTVDGSFTIAEAVAIRDGKFLAVGTSARILSLAGPTTKRIDLAGKSVVPGFIDMHAHGNFVGNINKASQMGDAEFTLTFALDKTRGLAELKKLVDRAKPGEWVINRMDRTINVFSLTRQDLDTVSPNNPVYFVNSGNEVLANTMALRLSGLLDSDTPGIVKDPKTREPTGQLWGFAAGRMSLDLAQEPPITDEVLKRQMEIIKYRNSQGVTTLEGRAQGLAFSIFKEIWQRGELTARIRLATMMLAQNLDLENYLKRVGNLTGFGNEWLKIIGGMVQEVDGGVSDGSLWTSISKIREHPQDPFLRAGQNKWIGYGRQGQKGQGPLQGQKTEWDSVLLANRYGWTLTSSHTEGDNASDFFLRAFAAADKERSIKGRGWAYDHGFLRTQENFELVKKLGVTHAVHPGYVFFARPDRLVFRYGVNAVHQMTPVKTVIDFGIEPVLEINHLPPLLMVQALVTRKDPSGNVWGASEAVSRDVALKMGTRWASRYGRDEKIIGSIEAGKLADFVVLGGDYMACPEDEISKLPVLLTVVGGRIVYDRDKDGVLLDPVTNSIFFPAADMRQGGGAWEDKEIPPYAKD